jgi:pyruvate dehydrogenase E1 component
MSDEDIWYLNRGGHDARKVYAAYHAAVHSRGQPTVILAKTVKGFGLGKSAEGQMVAHQQKKLDLAAVRELRDRFNIPVSDQDLQDLPFRKPAPDSDEMRYLQTHRKNLGGYLPVRNSSSPPLTVPPLAAFKSILEGTAEREISTTMAFVRILTVLLKDKGIGKHIVPIVPDEARTFGMEGLFRQIGIYSAVGQLYTPVDAETLMSYREDRKGQMLEEGINEAGSTCSWIAAATSYANHGIAMVPFYALARLPDGRHCRANHAGGRGPAAPGRAQPAGGDHDTQLPRLRPDLCLRAGGDHPGRHAAHVCPE